MKMTPPDMKIILEMRKTSKWRSSQKIKWPENEDNPKNDDEPPPFTLPIKNEDHF